MQSNTIILHGNRRSGHSHRVELFLRILGLPHEFRHASPEVLRSAEFLALNPLGQIPVIQDGELVLADSNAILVYLARRYDTSGSWYPEDPVTGAAVQRWLSIAAGELRFGLAAARVILGFGRPGNLETAQGISYRLLTFMEQHLHGRPWLAHSGPTIADLACSSYVAHAPEGGIDLTPYPHIRVWLERVADLPGFVPMQAAGTA